MHREEIAFVAQLTDQLQFMVDLLQGLRIDALRPTLRDAFFGHGAQPGFCVMAVGHQLARVVVAQLAQVEGAATCDGQGLVKQGLRVQCGQGLQAAQVPFAIGM